MVRPMFLVMGLLARYMTPSDKLLPVFEEWLMRKIKSQVFQKIDHLLKLCLVNFKVNISAGKPEKGLYVCWPPSFTEI